MNEFTSLPNTKMAGEPRRMNMLAVLPKAVSDRFKDATEGMQERVGQVADQAIQYAELARDAVKQFKPLVQKSLRDNPMTTLAGFVLIGFVLGAMWKK